MNNCLTCSHFVNWDGDWVCCAKMAILSPIKDGKTVHPENCTMNRCCPEYEDDSLDATPERTQYRKEEWEYYL